VTGWCRVSSRDSGQAAAGRIPRRLQPLPHEIGTVQVHRAVGEANPRAKHSHVGGYLVSFASVLFFSQQWGPRKDFGSSCEGPSAPGSFNQWILAEIGERVRPMSNHGLRSRPRCLSEMELAEHINHPRWARGLLVLGEPPTGGPRSSLNGGKTDGCAAGTGFRATRSPEGRG